MGTMDCPVCVGPTYPMGFYRQVTGLDSRGRPREPEPVQVVVSCLLFVLMLSCCGLGAFFVTGLFR
jgi:hypothetical protein